MSIMYNLYTGVVTRYSVQLCPWWLITSWGLPGLYEGRKSAMMTFYLEALMWINWFFSHLISKISAWQYYLIVFITKSEVFTDCSFSGLWAFTYRFTLLIRAHRDVLRTEMSVCLNAWDEVSKCEWICCYKKETWWMQTYWVLAVEFLQQGAVGGFGEMTLLVHQGQETQFLWKHREIVTITSTSWLISSSS